MAMLGEDEGNRRLGYHPNTPEKQPLYEQNRAGAIGLFNLFDQTLPPGRELANALGCIQEALMWANAAVACNPPGGVPAVLPVAPLTRSGFGDPGPRAPLVR